MVRVKFRYVVIQVVPENESKSTGALALSDFAIYNCVQRLVQQHYGDLGAAAIRSGLKCKYCNDQTRIAIIRIKHHPHRFVTSVLPLANAVGDHTVKLRTLYNGATIKQCNKFIVEHQKRFLDRKIGETVSAGQKKHLQRRIMDFSMA